MKYQAEGTWRGFQRVREKKRSHHAQDKEIIRDDELVCGKSGARFSFKGLQNLLLFERSLAGGGKQLGDVNDPSYQMLMQKEADSTSHTPAALLCR